MQARIQARSPLSTYTAIRPAAWYHVLILFLRPAQGLSGRLRNYLLTNIGDAPACRKISEDCIQGGAGEMLTNRAKEIAKGFLISRNDAGINCGKL